MSGLVVRAFGETLTGRWPSLEELSSMRGADRIGRHQAAKALCRSVLGEPFKALLARKPACAIAVAEAILEVCGVAGPLTEVEEHEIESEDLAKAFVKAQERGFAGLHVLRYSRAVPEFAADFILREPREREVDDLMRSSETFGDYKAFNKKLCVHGDVDALDDNAPGLHKAIGLYMLQLVGLAEEVTVGEA